MNEIHVPREITRQQDEAVIRPFARLDGGAAVKTAVEFQICLITNDRLDAVRFHCVKKRNRSVHIAVIGNGAGFHIKIL